MLTASGYRVFVGGNIGTPLLEYVEAGHRKDWLVVEVSSFQLDTMAHFRPRIGCLLNISEDHLDRYPDYAAYATSKWHLFSNQTADDTAIINGLIPDTETIVAALAGRPLFFNSAPDGWPRAARIQEKALRLDMGNGTGSVDVDLSSMHLVGRHNEENVAAAALATLVAGGSSDAIQAALNSFRGLPHRVSFVKDVNGVRYYDDSKATNVDAVARALDSFDDPVVLIMGGRDKGGSYGGLTERIRQNVSQLIVMGEAAGIISEAFGPVVPIRTAADMATAVRIAAQVARAGQVVLLSPACASFDMYDSYHQRGEDFCRQVQKLV